MHLYSSPLPSHVNHMNINMNQSDGGDLQRHLTSAACWFGVWSSCRSTWSPGQVGQGHIVERRLLESWRPRLTRGGGFGSCISTCISTPYLFQFLFQYLYPYLGGWRALSFYFPKRSWTHGPFSLVPFSSLLIGSLVTRQQPAVSSQRVSSQQSAQTSTALDDYSQFAIRNPQSPIPVESARARKRH